MRYSTAIKTALESMYIELKTLHFDANLRDKMSAEYPRAISASERRKKLAKAIVRLEEELGQ